MLAYLYKSVGGKYDYLEYKCGVWKEVDGKFIKRDKMRSVAC